MYKEWRPTDFIIWCIIKHMLVTCEQHKCAGLLQGRVPYTRFEDKVKLLLECKLRADLIHLGIGVSFFDLPVEVAN